jgi:cytochrome b
MTNAGRAAVGLDLCVWDPLVRAGHWLLILCILFAWLTRHSGGIWHEVFGYAALTIVGVRLIWGWCGTRYARFASFVRGAGVTCKYAGAMMHGVEPRHVGHNPLGGWMIIALLTTVLLISVTGWLYTTDRFWGVEWVETLHSRLTDGLFVLIALHIIGVLYASCRHRENLIAAMIHGRKRST